MLKRLQISNFQCIASSDINLDAINLIVGDNGSGKTAILRALKALCFNRRGDDFIRKGTDESVVILTTDQAGGVGWEKARGSSAAYHLSLPDQDQQSWKKTGTSVPDEVREFLHIGPIEIEKGFTITPQFPGPLNRDILAESGSRQARIIGVLTRLDVVVNAQRAARTDKNTATGQQEQAQLEVDKAKTLLEGLTWVEPMREKLDEIEQMLDAFDLLAGYKQMAEGLIGELTQVRVTLAREEDVVKARQLLDHARDLGGILQDAPIERWQTIQPLLAREEPVAEARKLMPQALVLGDTLVDAAPLVTRWSEVEPTLAREENVVLARTRLNEANLFSNDLFEAHDLIAQRDIVLVGLEKLGKTRDESQDAFNMAQRAYGQACDACEICSTCPFHKNPMEATG